MGLGVEEPCVAIHARIAREMNSKEGDEVDFEILEAGERFTQKVLIKDGISAVVIVYGAIYLGITKSERVISTH